MFVRSFGPDCANTVQSPQQKVGPGDMTLLFVVHGKAQRGCLQQLLSVSGFDDDDAMYFSSVRWDRGSAHRARNQALVDQGRFSPRK